MRDVDWDLLAEHLGGALDGTPEQGRVADLIATDPEWARAATRLSAALDAVAADLGTLPAPGMPDDVAARLDDTLRSAVWVGGSHVPAGNGDAGRGRAAADTPVHSRPSGRPAGRPRHLAGRPGSRWRRHATRWGSGLAVAAGVVAFAAFGISYLGGGDAKTGYDDGTVLAEDGRGHAPPGQPGLTSAEPRLLATGTDYHRSQLSRQAAAPFSVTPDPGSEAAPGEQDLAEVPPAEAAPGAVPAALRHLWEAPDACLSAVVDGYAPQPATVEVVDFAHFEGVPALVIWVTTGDGAAWVSVAGQECGSPGADADEHHRARVD